MSRLSREVRSSIFE
uniref:Putative disease resistance RPP13-like protein 1 n=1 Tax=Rhizophora mucronata TaxID=61149 RepID=A0A2P2LUT8_RHIMU